MQLTKCANHGICCENCDEDVNVHKCHICEKEFHDGDEIYCREYIHLDCTHYHKKCLENKCSGNVKEDS